MRSQDLYPTKWHEEPERNVTHPQQKYMSDPSFSDLTPHATPSFSHPTHQMKTQATGVAR